MVEEPAAKKPKLAVADELINSIPPPPHYNSLPYRHLRRAGTAQLPAGLPPKSYRDPYNLFLTEKHFDTIARNTNCYAKARNARGPGKRAWWPTSAPEGKVFIGIFIYMGVVWLPAYEDYWSDKYGHFHCSQH